MALYYFQGCKVKASFPEASERAAEYINSKFGVEPVGCCRVNHKDLSAQDTAIIVCNNCALIMQESCDAAFKFIWEIIDQDPDFPFPDYGGEEMTIQDCWLAYEKRYIQDTVRSLLKKMNINVVELEENYEATKFCGENLLQPCNKSNAELAPKRYVQDFPHMFTPMEPEQRVEHFQNHCQQIQSEKVVCYCKFCTDGINKGGKQGLYLLDLLFPNAQEQ